MEIRQQDVHDFEDESGRDEEIRRECQIVFPENPSGRRAAASSARTTVVPTATTRPPRAVSSDPVPRPGRTHFFRLERVTGRVVGSHRFERAGPNGERQIGDGDRALGETVEHFRREVETRSGCGDRERFAGENRLIGLAILRPVRGSGLSTDVRRQRHVSDAAQKRIVDRAIKDDLAPPVRPDFRDDGPDSAVELGSLPGLGAAAGLGQSEPTPLIGVEALEQEDLDETSLAVAAPKAGRPHGDVVAHEKIPGGKQLRQMREHPMGDRSALPVENEQPTRAAGTRLLGNPAGRQSVVEEIDAHVT